MRDLKAEKIRFIKSAEESLVLKDMESYQISMEAIDRAIAAEDKLEMLENECDMCKNDKQAMAIDRIKDLSEQIVSLQTVVKAAQEVFKQIDLRTHTLGLDMSNYHAVSIRVKPGDAGKDYWESVWAYNKALVAYEAVAEKEENI